MIQSKHISRSGIKLVLLAAISFPILTACVSSGKYDALMAEKVEIERQTLETKRTLHVRDVETEDLRKKQADFARELDELLVAGLITMELMADGLHLNLAEEILFASGKTQLHGSGEKVINNVSDILLDVPYQIVVTGNTDSVPVGPNLKNQYPSNWEIGSARASSVVRLMESKGVPSMQLAAVSFGSSRPIASNDTAEGRAENRNIEILLRPIIRQ